MANPDSECSLSKQVGELCVADENDEDSDRTIEILQHLENFFSTPLFTGSLQEFVSANMDKFSFVGPEEEQPLRWSFSIAPSAAPLIDSIVFMSAVSNALSE